MHCNCIVYLSRISDPSTARTLYTKGFKIRQSSLVGHGGSLLYSIDHTIDLCIWIIGLHFIEQMNEKQLSIFINAYSVQDWKAYSKSTISQGYIQCITCCACIEINIQTDARHLLRVSLDHRTICKTYMQLNCLFLCRRVSYELVLQLQINNGMVLH